MSAHQGKQHFVAQSHFRRFTSGRQGDGMFYVYDKTSPHYKNGLPRKLKGGKYERKPPGDLAVYDTHHTHDAEVRMGEVEGAMTEEWNRIKNTEDVFGPAAIPAIIRYMGLTEMRRPQNLRQWGLAVRARQGIVLFDETLRAMSSHQEPLKALQQTIQSLPSWMIHTLDANGDEYLISDRPAMIGFAGRAGVAWERSLAFMPMSKKQLLVGFWDESAIADLTFNADSVNGMVFHRATKEVYSHRLLDPEKVKSVVALEPLLQLSDLPNVRLVPLRQASGHEGLVMPVRRVNEEGSEPQ